MVIHSPYSTWDYNNLDNFPDNRRNMMDNVHACIGAGSVHPGAGGQPADRADAALQLQGHRIRRWAEGPELMADTGFLCGYA
jgi:hypothetical protein